MAKPVSLSEFVEAFSKWGKNVSAETLIWKDLSLDADELDWAIRDIKSDRKWKFHWSRDMRGFIPEHWQWVGRMKGYPDLKVRELFAFSRPTKADD